MELDRGSTDARHEELGSRDDAHARDPGNGSDAGASGAEDDGAALQSLGTAERALRGELGKRGATIALRDLALRRQALRGRDRDRADALFARPNDPGGDGYVEYTVPEATPICSAKFCIHYVATTADAPDLTDAEDADGAPVAGGNGVPDYVDLMLREFDYVGARENAPAPTGLGWIPPVGDGALGGGTDLFDVYVAEFDGALFGYASVDDPGDGSYQWPGYMVMDNDYSLDEFGYPSPVLPLQVTAAHEYNHVLQFATDIRFDGWFGESTATWMEDEVYPDIDDWQGYVRSWALFPEQPLTDNQPPPGQPFNLKQYGSAIVLHWFADRYGDRTIRAAWESLDNVTPELYPPAALNAAIAARGGVSLSNELGRFFPLTAEWRMLDADVHDGVELVSHVRREGALVPGQSVTTQLDHTGFRMWDVPTSGDVAKLRVTAPAGTSAALALVGRLGPEIFGELETRVMQLPAGGTGQVSIADPGRFARITAVVMNTDVSVDPNVVFDPVAFQFPWHYLKDAQPFSLRLVSDGTPPDTVLVSGPAGDVAPGGAEFRFSGDEPGLAFRCALDDAAFGPCTSPTTVTITALGQHTFSVQAVDAADNADPTPARREFRVVAPAATPPPPPPPLPPPPPAPAAGVSAASVLASIRSVMFDLAGALQRHGILTLRSRDPAFEFDAPATGTLTVTLKAGANMVASTQLQATRARTLRSRLRVTSNGDKLLRSNRARRTTLTVRFAPAGAPVQRVTRRVTLSR